jgi:polynucleotide 5'-hydroxyl-kinase GRC3/NOL9
MDKMNHQQIQELFPFLKQLDIPPAWDAAARGFLEQGGVVMVLGGPDTGKSTLSRYLVYRAFAAGAPAALVDLDLGQSHLGPPAALGLGLFPPRFPGDDSLFPDGLYFIGQTSPVGALLEVAVGCRVLVDLARNQGVQHVVVNTSGLIQGPAAFRLKAAQAELLQPRRLLALARGGELDLLLRAMGTVENGALSRLPVSARAARKSLEGRRAYREARFREYFAPARRLSLPLRDLNWRGAPLSQGRPLDDGELKRYGELLGVPALLGEDDGRRTVLLLEDHPPAGRAAASEERLCLLAWPALAYRLVGLLDGRLHTRALGLLLPAPWDGRSLTILTPLPETQARVVHSLHLGKLRVNPQGREI